MVFEEITLEGNLVRLEPLSPMHKEGLCAAIADGQLWKLFVTTVPHPDNIAAYFEQAQSVMPSGDGLVFAIIEKSTGMVVGSTRFMKANLAHKRVEIGSTFLALSRQKTRINTETKYLLLAHAFESLQLNRVELITDYLNQPSRNAILKLGAKEEGIMRNHMVMPDGRVRDSVLYSILKNDWPGIKQHLQFKLA